MRIIRKFSRRVALASEAGEGYVPSHNRPVPASESRNPMPHKRKGLRRVLLYALLALVAVPAAGVLWLAAGVRSLDVLKPYVQEGIHAAFAPYRVEAGSIRYRMDTGKWALVTGLENVTVHDEQGHRVASFSGVNLDLGLRSLLGGSISFDTLEVLNPVLRLTAQEDGRVTLSVSAREREGEEKTETSAPVEMAGLIAALRRIAVRSVVIRDAFLGIVSERATAMYRLPRVVFLLRDREDVFSLRYDVRVQESAARSHLTGSLEVASAKKTLHVKAALNDFNLALAAPFHPYGAYLTDASLRVSGTAEILTDFGGTLKMAAVDIRAKEGRVTQPELFPEPLLLDSGIVRAVKTEEDEALHIEELALENADLRLKAKGDLRFSEAGVGAKAEAELHGLKLDRIAAYWPPRLSVDARDWVTKYLTVGTVRTASATLEMASGDAIPTLDARLDVRNAVIEYLPGFPKIEGVDGKVSITARGLEVTSETGHSLTGTTLKKARFAIPDFADPAMPMELTLEIAAPARDVAEIIGPERLRLADALKLDPERVTGEAEGRVALTLPLYEAGWPKDAPYVIYDIAATLRNVGQKRVLGTWDIAGMNGDLAADNEKLTLATTASLQGVAAKLDIAREFGAPEKTTYALTADIPRDTMLVFGFKIPEEIQGTLGVEAKVEETGEKTATKATVNLANTTVRVPDLHYEKPLGVPATLNITQESRGDQTVVPAFRYLSKGAEVVGGYTQEPKTGEFLRVKLSKIQVGANDFALDYSKQNGRKQVSLRGKTLDLSDPLPEGDAGTSPSGRGDGENKAKNPLDVFMNARVELNLEKLLLSEGHGPEKLTGYVDCGATLCPSVHLQAQTENAVPFRFVIARGEKGRELTLASQDAGGVVKAFDISDHVIGGTLDFKGSFDDGTPEPILTGRMLMSDFSVVKGPILAKLLSLASLTGLLDALAGKGIAFAKLSGDVTYTDGMIRVKKGKAYGSSLGITLAGGIAPFAGTLDLKGTLVPAYTANRIIGQIPLIGNLLTGGEDGGVIAAKYAMKGDYADPDVTVNPLSLLTPGFLRNLFDVFDAPEEGGGEETAPKSRERRF